jgi:hypothetical protein
VEDVFVVDICRRRTIWWANSFNPRHQNVSDDVSWNLQVILPSFLGIFESSTRVTVGKLPVAVENGRDNRSLLEKVKLDPRILYSTKVCSPPRDGCELLTMELKAGGYYVRNECIHLQTIRLFGANLTLTNHLIRLREYVYASHGLDSSCRFETVSKTYLM